ncbi:DUF6438 domain-containing protein [Oceanicaulis sp. MMSF_3324]|uniref:DUF6438 domain-containing protein n=1 Tax=Oceanicaulis sp. MMSF_3324 TaxID=3046702 RepID=UPI00273F4A6B|nr:DUF6438 domain-containing protein [Oceanicaulis sp. MMSF_3324]
MFELAYLDQAASYDQIEEIRVEQTGCFGYCPSYIVSIEPNDAYRFCGLHFTGSEGPHLGVLPEHSFKALVRTLQDNEFLARNSVDYGGDNCTVYATDHPSAYISVSFSNENSKQLHWYSGCRIQDHESPQTRPRPTRLSEDAFALSAIVDHARELLSAENLLEDPDNFSEVPRERNWGHGFPYDNCGFDE